MRNFVLVSIFVFLLVGCATSTKISPVQPGDHKLNCSQLVEELQKLKVTEQEVNSKKGATGTNVAAAIFWLPGLLNTYHDAGQALDLIGERRSHLTSLFNKKDC